MTTNIEQMNINIAKMKADIQADRTRITLQVLGFVVTAFAAGIAAASLYFSHSAR